MKIATIVGARPQFIKAAAVSRIIRDIYSDKIQEILIHTGQHYDNNMSKVFFDELDIPQPQYNLAISGVSHGAMTGRMLEAIEGVLQNENPDWVIIYGDTNSTLAGAIAAAKLHIPIAHVEAGLRSFNMQMPEEINRILSDRVSSLLFCPTEAAVDNLKREGISDGVINVGDVMYDVSIHYRKRASQNNPLLKRLQLDAKGYALATCHRAENTDDKQKLGELLYTLAEITRLIPVVFPIHPRTRKLIEANGLESYLEKLTIVEPLPFMDMLALEQSAKLILTDSGGVQKEAYFYGVPCITLRNETEWVETLAGDCNVLAGSDSSRIMPWVKTLMDGQWRPDFSAMPYGSGDAALKIVQTIYRHTL